MKCEKCSKPLGTKMMVLTKFRGFKRESFHPAVMCFNCNFLNYLKVKWTDKVWYLAHPYSGNTEENFKSVNKISADLFSKGITFISPISMSHPIEQQGIKDGTIDKKQFRNWYIFDLKIMNRLDGIILCPGWEESRGCMLEKQMFEKWGKSVKYYHEGEIVDKI